MYYKWRWSVVIVYFILWLDWSLWDSWICSTGNCRTGIWRTRSQGWTLQDWNLTDWNLTDWNLKDCKGLQIDGMDDQWVISFSIMSILSHECLATKSCVAAWYQGETLYGCSQTNFTAPWLRHRFIYRWCGRRCGRPARSCWRLQRIIFVRAFIVWTGQWLGVRSDGMADSTQELKPAVRDFIKSWQNALMRSSFSRLTLSFGHRI